MRYCIETIGARRRRVLRWSSEQRQCTTESLLGSWWRQQARTFPMHARMERWAVVEAPNWGGPLQDFTVLPTKIFRRCVIERSSVNYLPTILSTELFRRNTFCRWFHIPSLYRSEIQKKLLPTVLPTDRARQKKKVSRLEYTDGLDPSAKVSVIFYTDRIFPSVNTSINLYRRIMSVGEYVGDGGRHCPMPPELFRR